MTTATDPPATPTEPPAQTIRPPRPSNEENAAINAYQAKMNDTSLQALAIWRGGFAAVLALASGGLTISALGHLDKAELIWRVLMAVCVVAGTGLGVWALMIVLRAEVGTGVLVMSHEDVILSGGPLALETARATAAAKRMHRSQSIGIASVVAFLAALGVLWLAPTSPPTPYLQIDQAGQTICGKILSADGGEVKLQVADRPYPIVFRLTDITNMAVVMTCPG